jgi:flagellar hook-associated protein 2
MSTKISGLISGMDTESIFEQLVSAKQTKVDDTKKAQTKLQWKQDAWKELNTKLKALQSKYLSNMRFTSSYSKKTTKVSNESAVSVITGEDAVNGVQSLQVSQLAKTGYLTGKAISGSDGTSLTALSKLSDITGGTLGDGTINVTAGDTSVDISVNGDTTISSVLTQLKNAGLNASFDAKNQRFFVSSKESGASNDFSITASDANGAAALSALGLQVNLNDDKASLAAYQKYASYYVDGDRDATIANMSSLIDKEVSTKVESYLSQYKTAKGTVDSAQSKIDEINQKYQDQGITLKSADEYQTEIDEKNAKITELQESLKSETSPLTDDEKAQVEEQVAALQEEVEELTAQKTDVDTLATQQKNLDNANADMAAAQEYITVSATTADDGTVTYSAEANAKLTEEVENSYYDKASYAHDVIATYDPNDKTATGATKVSGQDAKIILNGAEFTNSTNVFEINGLTFTALSETKEGEDVTITTQDDTDGIYDMVKNFLKEYNTIINEMDKLYNADSSSGYEPLTSEEKEAMSDSEVEEWESKIKDSILRRDDNLSTVSSALKSIMSAGITVNGKTMYLSSFGISTLSYFSAADNEKNAYHIDGDPDDDDTSGNSDVLKSMIASDSSTVISFFTQLSQNLYSKMSDLSKSVSGYRSYGSFYDDKKMESDYSDYTDKISDLEDKLNDYEDKWYSKFSAMETALAKLQSNSSAVTALLGG